jgi:predicted nucleic acid-binding protein
VAGSTRRPLGRQAAWRPGPLARLDRRASIWPEGGADLGCDRRRGAIAWTASTDNDTWIAACCIEGGLPLLTRNVRDFAEFAEHDGLVLLAA